MYQFEIDLLFWMLLITLKSYLSFWKFYITFFIFVILAIFIPELIKFNTLKPVYNQYLRQ